MTAEEKLTACIIALHKIRNLPEQSYGDHWSNDKALHTDSVHDIVDEVFEKIDRHTTTSPEP